MANEEVSGLTNTQRHLRRMRLLQLQKPRRGSNSTAKPSALGASFSTPSSDKPFMTKALLGFGVEVMREVFEHPTKPGYNCFAGKLVKSDISGMMNDRDKVAALRDGDEVYVLVTTATPRSVIEDALSRGSVLSFPRLEYEDTGRRVDMGGNSIDPHTSAPGHRYVAVSDPQPPERVRQQYGVCRFGRSALKQITRIENSPTQGAVRVYCIFGIDQIPSPMQREALTALEGAEYRVAVDIPYSTLPAALEAYYRSGGEHHIPEGAEIKLDAFEVDYPFHRTDDGYLIAFDPNGIKRPLPDATASFSEDVAPRQIGQSGSITAYPPFQADEAELRKMSVVPLAGTGFYEIRCDVWLSNAPQEIQTHLNNVSIRINQERLSLILRQNMHEKNIPDLSQPVQLGEDIDCYLYGLLIPFPPRFDNKGRLIAYDEMSEDAMQLASSSDADHTWNELERVVGMFRDWDGSDLTNG